jgi:hypothetical protein
LFAPNVAIPLQKANSAPSADISSSPLVPSVVQRL